VPLDAINNGFVPGMEAVGDQFAKAQMFLPDMMASAEAMRGAMAVLEVELRRQGARKADGWGSGPGYDQGRHSRDRQTVGGNVALRERLSSL